MPFNFPAPADLLDRGTYRYHRPTGSTVAPAFEFDVPPTCIVIDQSVTQIAYSKLREGGSFNFNENCVRKNGLSISNSATVLQTDVTNLFAGKVSEISFADLLVGNGMDEIGQNTYRHCATGSTLTIGYGYDVITEAGYCQNPATCSSINFLIGKVSYNKVTAWETPEGGCIKLPDASGSISVRMRQGNYEGNNPSLADLRSSMIEYSNAYGEVEQSSDAILHNQSVFTAVWAALGEFAN